MKRLLTIVGVGTAGLLLLAVWLITVLVVLNLKDDALEPEVSKLIAQSPPQIAAADNGYFAWIGVVGPETESAHAWGWRWYEEALAADEVSSTRNEEPPPLAIESEKRSERFSSKDLMCEKPETCLDDVADAPARAVALTVKADATFSRGDEAMEFRAYQEARRPDFNFHSFFPPQPLHWRQLAATRFALAVASDRHDEALKLLQRDIRFQTRRMQGAGTLVERMVAQNSLRNDYQLLNRYMSRHWTKARRRVDRIADMLAPPPDDALRMRTVMATECRAGIRLFLSMKDEAIRNWHAKHGDDPFGPPEAVVDVMVMPGYLPNATANEYYRAYRPIFELDDKSGPAYRQGLLDVARSLQGVRDLEFADLVVRNPIGHILARIGKPDVSSYYFRRDDLLVLRAAVALQLDLLRRGIRDDAAIGRAIRDAELVHPFTGETPVWDGAKHTLTYQPQRGRKDQPLALAFDVADSMPKH